MSRTWGSPALSPRVTSGLWGFPRRGCPCQQWLMCSQITLPFTTPQATYPCCTIPHILTSPPHAYKWFIRQSDSFGFWDNLHGGITCFQKSYKINDLFLCLYWQGGHLFKNIRSFHFLSHFRLVLTTISCYCLTTQVQLSATRTSTAGDRRARRRLVFLPKNGSERINQNPPNPKFSMSLNKQFAL